MTVAPPKLKAYPIVQTQGLTILALPDSLVREKGLTGKDSIVIEPTSDGFLCRIVREESASSATG
jgi:hypothetical protein